MKKFMKCLIAVGAIVGGAAGVLYFLDKKKSDENYDDFDDEEFEDVFGDDDRDYVTLDFENENEEENESDE